MQAPPSPDSGREFLQKEKVGPSCPSLSSTHQWSSTHQGRYKNGGSGPGACVCFFTAHITYSVSVGRNDGVLVPSPCVLGKKVDPAPKGGPLAEMAVSPESFPPPPSEPTSMPARSGYRWRPSTQAEPALPPGTWLESLRHWGPCLGKREPAPYCEPLATLSSPDTDPRAVMSGS